MSFSVVVKNTSDASVALGDVTIRYYFNSGAENPDELVFWCDHSAITGGCANVLATFVKVTSPGADYYLQIGFKPAAGSLERGDTSKLLQVRFNTQDYEYFTQSEHYSFDGTMTSFTPAPQIPAYLDGVLAWGEEP